ncbi:MAG: hypothetical protein ACYDAG_02840 [Chloroflexota bacterium]
MRCWIVRRTWAQWQGILLAAVLTVPRLGYSAAEPGDQFLCVEKGGYHNREVVGNGRIVGMDVTMSEQSWRVSVGSVAHQKPPRFSRRQYAGDIPVVSWQEFRALTGEPPFIGRQLTA